MTNEVYVIHHNGKRYDKVGRKIAYLTEGAAKSVITSDSKDIAKDRYDGGWYELSRGERNKRIEELKKEFEVITYIPKEEKIKGEI